MHILIKSNLNFSFPCLLGNKHGNFIKTIFLFFGFFIYCFSLFANDTIRFTWSTKNKPFMLNNKSTKIDILATSNEQFTIDWGDAAIDTIIGTGHVQTIGHTYADTCIYSVTIKGNTDNCLFTFFRCGALSLDLNKCPTLETLDCYTGSLTDLKLSANKLLVYLNCGNNYLDVLNIYENNSLIYLHCGENQLTDLVLSANTALKLINCSMNQLKNLDVSTNVLVDWLECDGNKLTDLELSTNTMLESLSCSDNDLTNLNLKTNTKLLRLDCSNNQLTTLDLKTNIELKELSCWNNRLQLLDLYNVSKMISDSSKKRLGTQRLESQIARIGELIDFSAQKEFDDVRTHFYIEKNNYPARRKNYTINDGVITFNKIGNYKIIMTNSAIVSHKNYPAQVIAELQIMR